MLGLIANRIQIRAQVAILLLLMGLVPTDLWAAEDAKPLFELGLGVGGVNQPYYPGTDDRRNVLFPVPLPIYRGKVFKSDSRGMRAEVVDEPRYRLSISADFNFAIDSDDIELRSGMDDIDTMLQVGPSLQVDLLQGLNNSVKLHLPVRLGMGIGSSGWSDDGMTFSPAISYHHRFQWQGVPWMASLQSGLMFGTEQFHDVYYTVADRYATEQRPAFSATGGYSGARVTASLRSRTNRRLIVLFARLDNLSGSEIEESPLVETRNGITLGFIYSRIVFRSKERAKRR